jgi:hypothetical protein
MLDFVILKRAGNERIRVVAAESNFLGLGGNLIKVTFISMQVRFKIIKRQEIPAF